MLARLSPTALKQIPPLLPFSLTPSPQRISISWVKQNALGIHLLYPLRCHGQQMTENAVASGSPGNLLEMQILRPHCGQLNQKPKLNQKLFRRGSRSLTLRMLGLNQKGPLLEQGQGHFAHALQELRRAGWVCGGWLSLGSRNVVYARSLPQ